MTPIAVSSPSIPVLSRLVFDDLTKVFTNKEIVFRVIHYWEARNPKKGGLLMGLELLLIDQKSTLIQAFITANRIGFYENNLKPGGIYKMKNFLVIKNKTSYRVSSHQFLIQFTHLTKLDEVLDCDHLIEKQSFRLRSFSQFEESVDKNEDLYDTVGKIILINHENFNNGDDKTSGKNKGRIEVHLQLRDGPVVRLTLWDNVALNFQKKLMKSIEKPIVLLATAVNPRTVRGMFCLSSTSSTRIFLDNDVEPTTEYFTWLQEEGNNCATINNITSEVTKSESITINELYEFLKKDTQQEATFSCMATILEILPHEWHYVACTKCATKLQQGQTTLLCIKCSNENAVGQLRYRVELSVYDKQDVATFVLFDREATKLTGITVVDALETVQGDDIGAINNHSSIPNSLLDLEGRTFNFQLKIKPYNFTATRKTITVSRILEEITDGDKIPEEETDGPKPTDNKGAITDVSETDVGDSENDDGETDANNQRQKRRRYKLT